MFICEPDRDSKHADTSLPSRGHSEVSVDPIDLLWSWTAAEFGGERDGSSGDSHHGSIDGDYDGFAARISAALPLLLFV